MFLKSNMGKIHEQLKKRRKELELKQEDMMLRVGMPRQQYQRLESKGNPQLDTLELVAKGLKMEVMLIPQENLRAVRRILRGDSYKDQGGNQQKSISDDPWEGLLED